MGSRADGITNRAIAETPIAVFDLETTGLTPGLDRVIEVSVVRKDPGADARLVLDTLVNPQRAVAATEIHGITDEDVADAPRFDEVAGELVRAFSGCVVAAYNVYFDIRFLDYELRRVGVDNSPPHFCLMYLRPMLGLGKRCALDKACVAHGIVHDGAHVASTDAHSAMRLMEAYLDEMRERKIATFDDLARLKYYRFVDSFRRDPLVFSAARFPKGCGRLKPRGVQCASAPAAPSKASATEPGSAPRQAVAAYWEDLKTVICDLEISDDELDYLEKKERELSLRSEQVRALHARAFASVLARFADDRWLDERERGKLRRLHKCLSRLGWAPGE